MIKINILNWNLLLRFGNIYHKLQTGEILSDTGKWLSGNNIFILCILDLMFVNKLNMIFTLQTADDCCRCLQLHIPTVGIYLVPCDRVLAGGEYIDEKNAESGRKEISGCERKSTCSLAPNVSCELRQFLLYSPICNIIIPTIHYCDNTHSTLTIRIVNVLW